MYMAFDTHFLSLFSSFFHGSSDTSLMVDLLSYFSFQAVFRDWYNKGRGMCYHVCGMVPINYFLLLIGE